MCNTGGAQKRRLLQRSSPLAGEGRSESSAISIGEGSERRKCAAMPLLHPTAARALQAPHGAQPGAERLLPIVEIRDRHEAAERLAFRRLRMLEHGLVRHHATPSRHKVMEPHDWGESMKRPLTTGREGCLGEPI